MDQLNTTAFALAPSVSRLNFPGHTATFVVKGTFDLVNGAAMSVAARQAPHCGPNRYPGDHEGSLRYDSDFAPFKPRADVLVAGSCHVPHGHPVPTCQVGIELSGEASISYQLVIVGDRSVDLTDAALTPSPPKLFATMPLRYERSFGGPEYAPNPVGIGHLPAAATLGEPWALQRVEAIRNSASKVTGASQAGQDGVVALPNILPEDCQAPANDAPPVGLGPIDPTWPLRQKKMGTYDDHWLKNRSAGYPDDFDVAHFNAAPPALQVDGYIHGNEQLTLTNLNPQYAKLRTQLPGVRVRCFVIHKPDKDGLDSDQSSETRVTANLCEVPMVIDTLWVDTDTSQAVLIWRGSTPVKSDEVEDIERVFVLAEPLDAPPQSIDQCHQRYIQAMVQAEAKPEPQPEPPFNESPQAEPQPGPGPEPGTFNPMTDPKIRAEIEAKLIREGHDEQTRAKVMDMLGKDPKELLKNLQSEIRDNYRKAGMKPTLFPDLTPEQQSEKDRLLRQWGLDPAEVAKAEQMYKNGQIDLPELDEENTDATSATPKNETQSPTDPMPSTPLGCSGTS